MLSWLLKLNSRCTKNFLTSNDDDEVLINGSGRRSNLITVPFTFLHVVEVDTVTQI